MVDPPVWVDAVFCRSMIPICMPMDLFVDISIDIGILWFLAMQIYQAMENNVYALSGCQCAFNECGNGSSGMGGGDLKMPVWIRNAPACSVESVFLFRSPFAGGASPNFAAFGALVAFAHEDSPPFAGPMP